MQLQAENKLITPARSGNVPGLLHAFVVLSLIVHGSAFLFSSEKILPTQTQRLGATIISAVLVTKNDKPEAPSRKSKTQPQTRELTTEHTISTLANPEFIIPPNTKHKRKVTPVRAPEKILPEPVPTVAISTSRQTSPTDNALISHKQQRNYLLGELQNRLSKYLTYPLRARRRGWQGEVMVAFHINEKGQLGDVHLTRSSGYSLLDHSALNAIAKLKSIDMPNEFGPLQAMNLQLPVHYRLQES